MILVHRLRGEPVYVNADLVETVEATPDTALMLVDGRRLLVTEPPEVVVERFVRFRAKLLVAADDLRAGEPGAAEDETVPSRASAQTALSASSSEDDGASPTLSVVPDREV